MTEHVKNFKDVTITGSFINALAMFMSTKVQIYA